MRISEAFPSEYLKAADLQGRSILVVISHVEMRDVGDDTKPVVFFQGKQRGVVMNKTNANNIALAYGDDTDGWVGKEVVLYEAHVDFQGRTVAAIRIRSPQPKDRQNSTALQLKDRKQETVQEDPKQEAPKPRRSSAEMDNEIPF